MPEVLAISNFKVKSILRGNKGAHAPISSLIAAARDICPDQSHFGRSKSTRAVINADVLIFIASVYICHIKALSQYSGARNSMDFEALVTCVHVLSGNLEALYYSMSLPLI